MTSAKGKTNKPLFNLPMEINLEDGYSYLIKDRNKSIGTQLVSEKELVGENVLYITRNVSEDITKEKRAKNALIWLTYNKGPNCIEPTNITRLSLRIQEFLKSNKNATIVFDGLEYLTSQNDFSTILHFIQLVNDKIMISDSKLILSINPNAFRPNELAQIEREMEPI
jgi:archaellum biogenesis ATPase FlaH